MKQVKKNYSSYLCILFLSAVSSTQIQGTKKKVRKSKLISQTVEKENNDEKTISINYNNTDLSTIINQLAALKRVNILLPATGIKEKVTFSLEKKLSIDEAWDFLQTILDIAEYTLTPKNNIYILTKNIKEIGRETLPIYLDTPYTQLPDTDEIIRYVHYLTNIKVSEDASNEITTLLKEILPTPASSFIVDAVSNSIIIAARSRDIKAVMEIISRLDQPGFEEKMEIIPLKYTRSDIIAELFNENILKVAQQAFQPYNIKAPQKSDVSYFEKDTRIMADNRTNSLIVVGRSQAVDRIKAFIYSYLDIPNGSGKSVLHVYELQYLNAEEFAPVLKKIVESKGDQGTGQSRAGDARGGVERYFEDVIIKADSFTYGDKSKGGANAINGSNKLIIAARNEDWKRIKELIQKLDVPKRQVFLEILVADLTIDDQRALGTMLRNPAALPLPGQMDFQSAHFNPGVIPNTFSTNPGPQTVGYIDNNGSPVASDLMRNTIDANGNKSNAGVAALSSLFPGGSTAVSFTDGDGKAWGILNILKLFGHTKILTHPHVLVVHNEKTEIEVGNTRLVTGSISGNINPQVSQETISASLKANMVVRISTSNEVNIQIDMTLNEFLPAAGNARTTRKVVTNANIRNGGILAIGGLSQTNEQASSNRTPFLSSLPLIGNLFKYKKRETIQTSLMVFICPTIIEPNVRNGVAQYTKDYIQLSKDYSKDSGLFSDLRDPITHWFFTSEHDEKEVVDQFFLKNSDDRLKNSTIHTPGERKKSVVPEKSRYTAHEVKEEKKAQKVPEYDTYAQDAHQLKTLLEHDKNPFKQSIQDTSLTT